MWWTDLSNLWNSGHQAFLTEEALGSIAEQSIQGLLDGGKQASEN